jgi:hypothetical protein
MNVVQFQANEDKQKKNLLELLDIMRKKVEEGEIEEMVCAVSDPDGEVELYVGSRDVLGAIGMFAVGQNMLIQHGEGWVQ